MGSPLRQARDDTANVQLYLPEASPTSRRSLPWMGAPLVGIGWGVKGDPAIQNLSIGGLISSPSELPKLLRQIGGERKRLPR